MIDKVKKYLPEFDTEGVEIHIMPPVEAMKFSLERVRKGLILFLVQVCFRRIFGRSFPYFKTSGPREGVAFKLVPLLAGGGFSENRVARGPGP